MRIEKIEVSNFKCFKNLKLTLNNFNVVIGKNASGKSNLVNILKFIKDLMINGIDDAIDLQGGINYLYNSDLKTSKNISIKFVISTLDDDEIFQKMKLLFYNNNNYLMIEKFEVRLEIQPNKRGSGYKIIKNSLDVNYVELEPRNGIKNEFDYKTSIKSYKKVRKMKQCCYQKDDEIIEKFDGELSKEYKNILQAHSTMLRFTQMNGEKYLLINYLPVFYLLKIIDENNIKIYDFNPSTLKIASIINKKNVLEEDGSNIANVLQRILKNSEEKRKLLSILKQLLPFIEDIYTEKSFNKSMYFKVKENNNNDLPSVLLSDGTVNIIATVVALYFEEDTNLIIIEEPEKNIHPKLVNKLVNLMKDVEYHKQVLITTHNTHLLSSVDLKDIIYVYRGENKTSNIERPIKKDIVKKFLENELDIGDLFYESLFTEQELE